MIREIIINNFRNHKGTRIQFGRLTVIAGPNGSGKTNVFRALRIFPERASKSVRPNSQKVANGRDIILRGTDDKVPWTAYTNADQIGNWIEWTAGNSGRNISPQSALWGFFSLKPQASRLSPSYSSEIPPVLEADGGNLASVLAWLMTSQPERFATIQNALRAVVPQIKAIRATREKVGLVERRTININGREVAYDEQREVTGDALIFDTIGANDLSASAISDGTLLTLAILTAVNLVQGPRLLLVDDIETGLHPGAQQALITQLRAILDQDPELQIVATTHSPYIIDQCAPEEVWLLAPDADGYCQCKQLSDHPKAKEALEILSTGEFWSAEGEDWVLDPPKKLKSAKQEQPEAVSPVVTDAH